MKKIKVTCTGADVEPLGQLLPFQGDLKRLTPENLVRLETSLIKHGFNSPVHIWVKGKQRMVLDGHQRLVALRSLAVKGYEVPTDIPVNYIEAANEKAAKEILLTKVAQYGQVTEQGLYAFMSESQLDVAYTRDHLPLPGIDFHRFEKQFVRPEPAAQVEKKTKQSTMVHTCPNCGTQFGKGAK